VFGQHCKPRDRETLIVITCHEELVSAQPCGHVFHDVCLQQWARTKVLDTKLALTSMPCDLRTTRDACDLHVFGRAQGDTYGNVQCPTCKLRPDEALLGQARVLEAAAQPPPQGDVIEHIEDEAVIVEDEAVLDAVPP